MKNGLPVHRYLYTFEASDIIYAEHFHKEEFTRRSFKQIKDSENGVSVFPQ